MLMNAAAEARTAGREPKRGESGVGQSVVEAEIVATMVEMDLIMIPETVATGYIRCWGLSTNMLYILKVSWLRLSAPITISVQQYRLTRANTIVPGLRSIRCYQLSLRRVCYLSPHHCSLHSSEMLLIGLDGSRGIRCGNVYCCSVTHLC